MSRYYVGPFGFERTETQTECLHAYRRKDVAEAAAGDHWRIAGRGSVLGQQLARQMRMGLLDVRVDVWVTPDNLNNARCWASMPNTA